ncbi:box C/D snoRNA protein 1 [Betta splendens]|uniref:Box C/D snoRNA protein 1 n=1 Tax=Betta splendens TaxID=158456 RepID=A0A6P7MB72_BETSP|nr:box C/D snoRNA protein 1 [Betta splendens]
MSAVESLVEDSGQEGEQKGTKRKISLLNCGVCGSEEAKYRCPACLTHSCSLLCVNRHKKDSGCTGVRDKTAFVTLSHFDEMTLLNDYRLLEDTGRFADGATRDRLVQTPHTTLKAKKLRSCASRMNITLSLLPITFTKSRENSTVFTKDKQFMWHLKLIFPQSSTEFSQRRVSDKQTLKHILRSYIHPTESDPVTRQKLRIYVQAPPDHVKVFMKAEGRKANSVRYHELDMEKSLRDNLSYKTLIEYPVLYVVLREHWEEYPLKGRAEPVSACCTFTTETGGVDRENDVKQVSTSLQGSHTPGGVNIWMGTSETRSEIDKPQQKGAKRKAEGEELEEGELTDSSEEENDKHVTPDNKSCDQARSPATEPEVVKDEVGDDMDINVDEGVIRRSDGSTDQCIKENVIAFADDTSAVTESAEVSVSKENAAKESELVCIHQCQDENESANAADSCG